MHPIEAIYMCYKKYAVFKGRAKRSEFWWFLLFVLSTIAIFFYKFHPFIALFVIVIPLISVTVRRLHDRNRPGWWAIAAYVLIFVGAYLAHIASVNLADGYFNLTTYEVVGVISLFILLPGEILFIIILFWAYKKGDEFSNKYGPNPLK